MYIPPFKHRICMMGSAIQSSGIPKRFTFHSGNASSRNSLGKHEGTAIRNTFAFFKTPNICAQPLATLQIATQLQSKKDADPFEALACQCAANNAAFAQHVENPFLPHSDGKVLFVMLKAERAKTEKKDLETTPFGVES